MNQFKTAAALSFWLAQNGINIEAWGQGDSKTAVDLWHELAQGDSQLDQNPPQRLVRVVQVMIRRDDQILWELAQELADGRVRQRRRPPADKMKLGETPAAAARRCVREEIGAANEDIIILPGIRQHRARRSSASYPGLPTSYVFFDVDLIVKGLPVAAFRRPNTAFGDGDPVRSHLWGWVPAN